MSITPVRLTIEDLDATPDDGNRYELIDGEIYMSTAPGFLHQGVLTNLLALLWNHLRDHPEGAVRPGIGVIFDDQNAVVPDLIYASNKRVKEVLENGKLMAAPEIAIEILSPGASNVRRDENLKLNLYAAHGVEEYWVVDPINHCVDVHRRSGAGGFDIQVSLRGSDELVSPILPGFRPRVFELFMA